MKQILNELEGEIECNAFILGDFNTPLTPKDRSTRQKISKDTEALNNTLEQMDLDRHLQNFTPKSSRIHILLKRTWNIFKNRSYTRPQKECQ